MTCNSRISFSDIGPDEIPLIQQLAREIWYAHYPGIITIEQIDYMLESDYSSTALSEDLVNGVTIRTMSIDGTVAGFAAYGVADLHRTSKENDQQKAVKLHKLYLLPSFHGQGLGSMFLAHIEEEVRESGGEILFLNVNKHNTKAIRSYERNGYRRDQSVVVDIGGGFVMDDYIMVKQLA